MLDVYSCQQLCIAANSMDCSRNVANRVEVLNEDIVAISNIYSMLNKLEQKLFVHVLLQSEHRRRKISTAVTLTNSSFCENFYKVTLVLSL